MAWAALIFVCQAVSVICLFPSPVSIIQVYSLGGSLFLLIEGQYFFFFFPEWYIYGGIGMAVAVLALLNILAFSNVSVRPTAGDMALMCEC